MSPPIDRRVDGTEVGRHEHTHAAGGARVTSSLDIGSPSGEPSAAAGVESTPARDEEFYINGADCVIRVEDTLFRVSGAF